MHISYDYGILKNTELEQNFEMTMVSLTYIIHIGTYLIYVKGTIVISKFCSNSVLWINFKDTTLNSQFRLLKKWPKFQNDYGILKDDIDE